MPSLCPRKLYYTLPAAHSLVSYYLLKNSLGEGGQCEFHTVANTGGFSWMIRLNYVQRNIPRYVRYIAEFFLLQLSIMAKFVTDVTGTFGSGPSRKIHQFSPKCSAESYRTGYFFTIWA